MDIDLNCDLGEGYPFDADLMPLLTSANIACGFHAGDPLTMRRTLALAARYQVQVGAHPGFQDRENFGRRELNLSQERIFDECIYQIGALIALARAAGVAVRYLKPHGALYNLACRDETHGQVLIAVAEFFGLPLMGLAGSRLQTLCGRRCAFVAEGFADRRYQPDGSLMPRSGPGAFVESPEAAVAQVEQLIRERGVQSICVHGDNPQALEFVRQLRAALTAAGHRLTAFPTA
ncbi:MAG: LamB/YcsF family protein [Planctomycetia bacterium]|nr:LamB/YcsF family protein [Planctomycetia bacterium]